MGKDYISPHYIPRCYEGGSHRYSGVRFINDDKTEFVRACRWCETVKLYKIRPGTLKADASDVHSDTVFPQSSNDGAD